MSSQAIQLQKQVQQLRAEAGINRMKASETIKEMVEHIQKCESTDPFVAGISQSENPFKDQKGCLIL